MATCGKCGKTGASIAEIRVCFASGGAAVVEVEAAPLPEKPTITEGVWRLPDGTVYKVQTSRGYGGGEAGRLYGKRLVWLDEPVEKVKRGKTYTVTGELVYEAGVPRTLREGYAVQLGDEDAAMVGSLASVCMFCGLDLTDERSQFAGYGKDCASNRSLPWGETAPITKEVTA